MSQKVLFESELEPLASFDGIASIKEMNAEPSLTGADPAFARESAGELTRRILDSWSWDDPWLEKFVKEGKRLVIDTRVQRLMPGMYPSIPGWHCDAIPRPNYNAQPDFELASQDVKHYTGLIATDESVSNTEFVRVPTEVEISPDEPAWTQVHKHVQAHQLETMHIRPGTLYRFGQFTIHRATPTVVRGWRLFFRLSIYYREPLNLISKQQQVYLVTEGAGW